MANPSMVSPDSVGVMVKSMVPTTKDKLTSSLQNQPCNFDDEWARLDVKGSNVHNSNDAFDSANPSSKLRASPPPWS